MVANSIILNPQHQIDALKSVMEIMQRVYTDKTILRPDMDYGVIPGTAKPTLLQPGAEKLMRVFRLCPRLTELQAEINFENNWILYRYRAEIIEIDTDAVIGYAIGSCNSFEDKYRWRWVDEYKVPPSLDKDTLEYRVSSVSEFEFAYKSRETTGKYGKPESYWIAFDEAIADGTAKKEQRQTRKGSSSAWVIESRQYRIPNPQIFDQLNTIDKMAQKRAFVSAVKAAVGASEYFTVDIEDMPEFSDFIPSTVTVESPETAEAEIITEFFADNANIMTWVNALYAKFKDDNESLTDFGNRIRGYLNEDHNSGFDKLSFFAGVYTEQEATDIVKNAVKGRKADANNPVESLPNQTDGSSALDPAAVPDEVLEEVAVTDDPKARKSPFRSVTNPKGDGVLSHGKPKTGVKEDSDSASKK